jgi:hypothetical protein
MMMMMMMPYLAVEVRTIDGNAFPSGRSGWKKNVGWTRHIRMMDD